MKQLPKIIIALSAFVFLHRNAQSQFIDNFDGKGGGAPEGWVYLSGDGEATVDFVQSDGHATLVVDATRDKRNIWWALTRHKIPEVDIRKLMKPENELRVETRIRVSHAPRRVNLHFNHQRTTDYHSHLMEFDIPDTVNWHTISMTTRDFAVQPGDTVNAHIALMDWGSEIYEVDIDYFKVDVVNKNTAGDDLGVQLPYHPPVAEPSVFRQHVAAAHDATVDSEYPHMNFNNWMAAGEQGPTTLLSVGGTQIAIVRWNLEEWQGQAIAGSGLLELTTWSLQRAPEYQKDFGMVRVVEILAGDPAWEQEKVTFDSFVRNKPLEQTVNTQMIIDWEVAAGREEKTFFTISQPVLQRMLDGKTLGLAIRPLGAVSANFFSIENEGKGPVLHFNVAR